PYQDLKDVNPERFDGTCTWFTTHPLFDSWLNGPPSILWAFAYPGCGKSILARYLVDQVLPSTETRTTCYFFFKGDSGSHRSLPSAMCSILRQLFKQRPELLSNEMLAEFKARSTITQSFIELWDVFTRAINLSGSGEIVCIIDALDECNRDGEAALIAALNQLYHSGSDLKPSNLRFFLTSCPLGYAQRNFQPLGRKVLHIDLSVDNQVIVDQIAREIGLVVESKMHSLRQEINLSLEEARHLQGALSQIPNRMDLGVHLVSQDIKSNARRHSWDEFQKILHEAPRMFDTGYARILNSLHDGDRANRLLPMVDFSDKLGSIKNPASIIETQEGVKTQHKLNELEPETMLANSNQGVSLMT
ncbi:hypothetical protein EV127DRAFT_340578, partial [Xylaria flabelliformis]